MASELLKASSGVELSLYYPDSIPTSIIQAVAVPAVLKTVAAIAREGIIATSVVVEAVEMTRLKIAYYREYSRVIREDVIPIAAMTDAHQQGRRMIGQMRLPDDLEKDALEDLERVRQKRRRHL